VLFGIVVQYNFKSIFYLKIYQNNFFKLFFTSIHQNNKKTLTKTNIFFKKSIIVKRCPMGKFIYL
jgi:hypothetical protein